MPLAEARFALPSMTCKASFATLAIRLESLRSVYAVDFFIVCKRDECCYRCEMELPERDHSSVWATCQLPEPMILDLDCTFPRF